MQERRESRQGTRRDDVATVVRRSGLLARVGAARAATAMSQCRVVFGCAPVGAT
ncbi:hypothetical protein GLA29479_4196 [Lysobacter antibioticus]|nr:hypothetical protein GLA29479_4196 [Lysobacter antibioticus]